MKLFVSKKKYDLLNKEYLLLNDKHEELKDNYEAVNISNEINLNNIVGLENQILSLNQEIDLYDNTVNDLREENEKLKKAYEEKNDRALDLEYKNEHSYFEKADLKNEVEILNQEVKLYQDTVKDLEEEIDKLKKANKELAKLWNDTNRKLWCNNESVRQLRKLSEDILDSQRIDKNQLASYIYDISMYIGGGVGVELKSKDK